MRPSPRQSLRTNARRVAGASLIARAACVRRSVRVALEWRQAERCSRGLVSTDEARIVVDFARHPLRQILTASRIGDIAEARRIRGHHARSPIEAEENLFFGGFHDERLRIITGKPAAEFARKRRFGFVAVVREYITAARLRRMKVVHDDVRDEARRFCIHRERLRVRIATQKREDDEQYVRFVQNECTAFFPIAGRIDSNKRKYLRAHLNRH